MEFIAGIAAGVVFCVLATALMAYVEHRGWNRSQGPSQPPGATSEPVGHSAPPGVPHGSPAASEGLSAPTSVLGEFEERDFVLAGVDRALLTPREVETRLVSPTSLASFVSAYTSALNRASLANYEADAWLVSPSTGLRPACRTCGRPVLKAGARLCLDCQPRAVAFPGI